MKTLIAFFMIINQQVFGADEVRVLCSGDNEEASITFGC
jgi:hypothetical protein